MRSFLILIFFILLSVSVFGEDKLNTSDLAINGIDIRAIVQAQIDSARQRELRGEIKSFVSVFNKEQQKKSVQEEPIPINVIKEPFQAKEESEFKYFLMIGFSVVVLSGVFIRRRFTKSVDDSEKELKENIKTIREESIPAGKKVKTEPVRSELIDSSDSYISENSVSEKAKELKISKGEIYLAAKLKSFQLAQLSSGNK